MEFKTRLAYVNTFFFWASFALGVVSISQNTFIYYDTFQEGLFWKGVSGEAVGTTSIGKSTRNLLN